MLLPTSFRDRAAPRDLRRPWRDPPGFFRSCEPCCPPECEPACTPACGTTGSVGSESGSECTDCANLIINDTFSGALDAAWTTAGVICAGNGIHPTFGAHTTGGVLSMGSGAVIVRPFDRPALAGFCVQVKVTLVSLGTGGGVSGITLGYGRQLFLRSVGDYGVQSCIDSRGCVVIGSTFSTIAVTPTIGDVLEIIIRDEGGADGICSVCYQINGTTVRVEEGAQFCFECEMWAGLGGTRAGQVSFDDFQVLTS